jgi:hypothetical protein
MKLNIDDLRRHYASLSDEALGEIDRSELVEVARACYDHELAQREPGKVIRSTARDERDEEGIEDELDNGGETPDWAAEGACVCSFASSRGRTDAEDARVVLEKAGVPCYLELYDVEPDDTPPPQSEYRVMVPSGLNLRAMSVLDEEIFNEKMESGWRTHLETLADEELFGKKEILLGGLLDRVARVSKAYDEEVARRTKTSNQ